MIKKRMLVVAPLLAVGFFGSAHAGQTNRSAADPSATARVANLEGYDFRAQPDRFTVFVHRTRRGTSTPLDPATLEEFCADLDGCSVRIGMHNWDETGRVSSVQFLFFLNSVTGNWQSSLGTRGSDKNNIVQHVNRTGSCYLTDGTYDKPLSNDRAKGFGLLSGNEYNADCMVTIID